MYVSKNVRTYVRMNVLCIMHACMFVCMYVCACVRVCVHTKSHMALPSLS